MEERWLGLILAAQLVLLLTLYLSLRRGEPAEGDSQDAEPDDLALPLVPSDPRIARALATINYGSDAESDRARRDLLMLGPGIVDELIQLLVRSDGRPPGIRPTTRLRIEEVIADFGIPGHLALRRTFAWRTPSPTTEGSLLRIVARAGLDRLPELLRDPPPLRDMLLGGLLARLSAREVRDLLGSVAEYAPTAHTALARWAVPHLVDAARSDGHSIMEREDAGWEAHLPTPILAVLALETRTPGPAALAALRTRCDDAGVLDALVAALFTEAVDPMTEALARAIVLRTVAPLDGVDGGPGGVPHPAPRPLESHELLARLAAPSDQKLSAAAIDRLLVHIEGSGPIAFASVLVLADAEPDLARPLLRRIVRSNSLLTLPPTLVRLGLRCAGEVGAHALEPWLNDSLRDLEASRIEWLVDWIDRIHPDALMLCLGQSTGPAFGAWARVARRAGLGRASLLRRVIATASGVPLIGAIRWASACGLTELADIMVDAAIRCPEVASVVADGLLLLGPEATPDVLARMQQHADLVPAGSALHGAKEALVALAERG